MTKIPLRKGDENPVTRHPYPLFEKTRFKKVQGPRLYNSFLPIHNVVSLFCILSCATFFVFLITIFFNLLRIPCIPCIVFLPTKKRFSLPTKKEGIRVVFQRKPLVSYPLFTTKKEGKIPHEKKGIRVVFQKPRLSKKTTCIPLSLLRIPCIPTKKRKPLPSFDVSPGIRLGFSQIFITKARDGIEPS